MWINTVPAPEVLHSKTSLPHSFIITPAERVAVPERAQRVRTWERGEGFPLLEDSIRKFCISLHFPTYFVKLCR